ncbi:MAG: restriction endonuclease subunit S, partial [Opitutae bacterium]|nr:restriction endonuclease subunit S [Opitutae bacterium]
YIRSWLCTDDVYGAIEGNAAGSTNQVELTATLANGQPTPLPPLAEQKRIVAKVDELMALCDALEAQLTTSQSESQQLLEACLNEAIA